MNSVIHPVLLCGGAGTRLWPLSRKSFPKQFAQLTGNESLFQASARRLSGDVFAPPLVVSGSDFRFTVLEQLAAVDITPSGVLIEPAARNTAAAILAAALYLADGYGDALILAAPSDHVIPDNERFRKAVYAATPTARAGQLVTFGVRPDRAETGYGWLELSEPATDFDPVAQPLKRFVEKPSRKDAEAMLADGRHVWNAGIFLFTANCLIEAFRIHAPEILAGARASLDSAHEDLSFTRLGEPDWMRLPDLSIDYAIMERAKNLSILPYSGVWSDLGGWEAVWREAGPDAAGLVTQGAATSIDCENSLLRSDASSVQLVGIGLRNIVAVAMPDAVLIADKDRVQDVKLAVKALKDRGATQAESFAKDFRPWGWFESLVTGNRFQVKRIVVHPGAALSLQSHHHRAEHWIVVEGTARVTIDADIRLVTENQSVYIPLGAVHRLENPGKVPMILIEVQTGTYLGEDDIIRYDDIYARGQGAKG